MISCDGPRSSSAALNLESTWVRQRRQIAFSVVVWFIAFGVVAIMTSTAWGQAKRYKTVPLNKKLEEPATMKRMEYAAKAFSTARDLSLVKDANVAKYYFSTYIPAKITQPDSVDKINELMEVARTRMISSQRSGNPGARQIMGSLYTGLKPIAQGDFSPPARIAAISFLSRMDVTPANISKRTGPVPLPYIPADFMPIYLDEKSSEGVRAAALQGLHRYVRYAGPALKEPIRGQLVLAMQTLLKAEPPEGRDEAVHAYLQRFAVDILADLRQAADPVLGKTLVSISSKTENHDLIALHSAAQLGAMSADLKGSVGSTSDLLSSWSVRAMRSFQYEIARLNALERPQPVSAQPKTPDSIASARKDDEPKKKTALGMGSYDGMDMDEEMQEMGGGGSMQAYDGMSEMDEMDEMEMMMGGAFGGLGGVVEANPQPPEVLTSRRKLNYVLQQLHRGVSGSGVRGTPKTAGGLLAAVEAGDKPLVQDWLEKMEEVVTALNDPALDQRDSYIEALDAQVTALKDIAGPAAVAASEEIAIKLPGISGPVAITVVEEEVAPDAPQLDASGAPKFPMGDELSPE